MICPICGYEVDSDDDWYGDKCLRCALELEREKSRRKVQLDAEWNKYQRCYGTIVDTHDWIKGE